MAGFAHITQIHSTDMFTVVLVDFFAFVAPHLEFTNGLEVVFVTFFRIECLCAPFARGCAFAKFRETTV